MSSVVSDTSRTDAMIVRPNTVKKIIDPEETTSEVFLK